MQIRPYTPEDYVQVRALYEDGATYGGQLDPDRDSAERLEKRVAAGPQAILVAEQEGAIVGTVSVLEDGRMAWLTRFAVRDVDGSGLAAERLCATAISFLKSKGHRQVLVYAPSGDARFSARYARLGFETGGDYTCYWKEFS